MNAMAIEEHLDVHCNYQASSIRLESEHLSGSSLFAEVAGATYWGHVGIVYKVRMGSPLTINNQPAEPAFGYNTAIGIGYITKVMKNFDIASDINLMWCWDKSYGYDTSIGSYSINTFLLELHSSVQFKYYTGKRFSLNAGVDLGIPVFCRVEGGGALANQSENLRITGFRVMPFAGIGFVI